MNSMTFPTGKGPCGGMGGGDKAGCWQGTWRRVRGGGLTGVLGSISEKPREGGGGGTSKRKEE